MEIVQVKTSELVPYERNAKEHPEEQVEHIANSIKAFGFRSPIVAWKDGTVINGHGRLLAAYKLGLEEVPVIYADDLTEEEANAFRLADNKTAESSWDEFLLADELAELIDFDMGRFGFDLFEEETFAEVVEDDFTEEVESRAKLGDVWKLGNHRLICGDSTDVAVVDRLMDGVKADMVFTDPPYLMGFEGNVHADGTKSFNAKHGAILNDKMTRKQGDDFCLKIFEMIRDYCIGSYYVCFYRLGLDYIFRALDALKNKYKALIIWNKGNHTLSNSDYMSTYEPIVYGWFNEHNFYGDRSNFDIWDIERTKKNDLHPTMKPISLVAHAIDRSSKKEQIVLDLFGGSGSTLIACEQLNRKCYMCELDPHYCDVIRKRYTKWAKENNRPITSGCLE